MSVQRGVQSVFRAANERLRERFEALIENGRQPVICECADTDCMEVLDLTPAEYRKVRMDGYFVIARGHDEPEIERVVAQCDGYDVVDKG